MLLSILLVWLLGINSVIGETPLPIFKVKKPVWDYTYSKWEEINSTCSWYCAAPSIFVSATSSLKQNGKISYQPANVHDGDTKSAWIEGKADYGIGEFVEFKFETSKQDYSGLAVTGFDIANGYKKNRHTWEENSRVKRLKMYVDDNPFGIIVLKDAFGFQRVEFGSIFLPKGRDMTIKLEIVEVYEGTTYSDVAITEITFDGTGDH